jgi:hypothetical protein
MIDLVMRLERVVSERPVTFSSRFSRFFAWSCRCSRKFPIASQSGSMTLKSTPCTCTASALAAFIRRVAHIDLVSAIRHTNDIRPLFVARRNISTFHRLQSQGTSPHETVNSTSYAAANLEDSIPFDQAHPNCKPSSLEPRLCPLRSSTVDNVDEGRWAVGDLEKKHTVSSSDSLLANVTYNVGRKGFDSGSSSLSEITHNHEGGAAVLELTPETIDALATESLEDNVHTKSYAAQRMWEARPNRSPVSMRGFTLHYSSPPVPTTPKAREAQKRNPTTPESQVPDSAIVDHHRSPVAEREHWQIQKAALKEKFKEGWNPRKKLSPDALAGIRAVHAQFPEQYTTSVLAEKFEVSPEAIRRILKSRWTPKEEEALDRQRRWFLRGQKVWSRYAELGLKPPARWRKLGIGKKDGLATSRSLRQSADTNVTMRSADYAVRESDETFSSTSASMAERIL